MINVALPSIIEHDVPELVQRISFIVKTERKLQKLNLKTRSVQSEPPVVGLLNIRKLAFYFLDRDQITLILNYVDDYLACEYDGDKLYHKTALLRLLAVMGESTKYISKQTKLGDTAIPWKNLEKIRDLLSHGSRVPIRTAIISLLKNEDPNGQNPDDQIIESNEMRDLLIFPTFIVVMLLVLSTFCEPFSVAWIFSLVGVFVGLYFFAEKSYEGRIYRDRLVDLTETYFELPDNCLDNIATIELPIVRNRLDQLLHKHKSLRNIYKMKWWMSLVIMCPNVLLSLALWDSYTKMLLFVVLFQFLTVLVLSPDRTNGLGYNRYTNPAVIWYSLRDPKGVWEGYQEEETIVYRKLSNEEIDDLLADVTDENHRELFGKALKRETEIENKDKKLVFKYASDKEKRRKWSEALFGVKPKRKKVKSDSGSKEKRVKELVNKHLNSTLNREKGFPFLISMRKFLKNPSEETVSLKRICVSFAMEEINIIEEIVGAEMDPIIRKYALEYHMGVYALFAAQIKWNYPELIPGINHITMRDYIMHGENHSYSDIDVTQYLPYLQNEVKPLLEQNLGEAGITSSYCK
eukprot:TRINITY_DN1669_c0_g1_i2.p1 TRINITY_DN1669_c0_g1~~TRINITY_DN1669_c0_g1_i2.p1  ORF type:complete len:577 (+),score=106.03 TRINITY_DN1669_c0_g1_i2:547-2277(+)